MLFPKRCIICHQHIKSNIYPSWICRSCYEEIEFIKNIECEKCGSPFNNKCLCHLLNHNISYIRSLFIYDNVGKELIHKWKFSGLFFIKDLFEKLIKRENFFTKYDGIIAVPIHFTKKILRGFNQAFVIADIISKNFNIQNLSNNIKRKKFTKPQMKIKDYKNREKNVKNIFKVIKPFNCSYLLIVDDIITSCSTVNEIAITLRKSNYTGKIDVFTLGLAL